MRNSMIVLGSLVLIAWTATTGAVDEIPTAFAPFEHMVGSWKGTASPTVNRVKGWSEAHSWAWKFEKGKPIAMTVEWQGDRTLSKGMLSYNKVDKKYTLDGIDPAGKAIKFAGSISLDGKFLTLDKVSTSKNETRERMIVRPNANKIRYTLQVENQEVGAPQFKKQVEVGLTKAGESFAAGAGGETLPKCIMTGGAATITVNYQGKSYPVCCTGCRDEFNENPEKYAKKADEAARSQPAPGRIDSKKSSGATNKDDGSFDGLLDDVNPKKTPK